MNELLILIINLINIRMIYCAIKYSHVLHTSPATKNPVYRVWSIVENVLYSVVDDDRTMMRIMIHDDC